MVGSRTVHAALERQRQHRANRLMFARIISPDAIAHERAAAAGRERTEYTIEERKQIRIAGVRLRALARVVNLVHVWRYPEQHEHAIERARHADVCVLEYGVERTE